MDSGKLKIIFRNIGAVVLGVIVGAMVNMGIIMISGSIIPPPEGTDLTTPEGIAKAMPLMEKKHFISILGRRHYHGIRFTFSILVQCTRFSIGLYSHGFYCRENRHKKRQVTLLNSKY